MDDYINSWLFDIKTSIEEIDSFFPDGKVFEAYRSDLKTRRAVERNIEIIGEAMTLILKRSPEIPISNSRKIVDARNRIIHGYDDVSDDVIWGIIVNNLPVLKSEVTRLLPD
ncbi:MAG TPA: HepT-like ribonuclease domain-containing protein [Flavobacterium sp.]|nr:HepT-like ribonuclease domain-containing protein [Flavobacterium sp.]